MKFKKASIFTTLVIAVLMVYALISLFVVHRQTRQLPAPPQLLCKRLNARDGNGDFAPQGNASERDKAPFAKAAVREQDQPLDTLAVAA